MIQESPQVIYSEIGRQHKYEEVWALQKHLQAKLVKAKRSGDQKAPGYLLLCEHGSVFTLGKSGKIEHLKVNAEQLKQDDTEFFNINRGGDITYHGPGQITGYPILDLDQYYNDLHRYVRELEEVVIKTLQHYGIMGQRVPGYTGVWVIDEKGRRKICAIGVHMSRWVSMHGFALNVATDLTYFNQIIPCGIVEDDTSVTSIANEISNKNVQISDVRILIKKHFAEIFGFKYIDSKLPYL